MPKLERITIYPIKSLDGVDVAESTVGPGGSLAFDRRWALCDTAGQFVNGKRSPEIHPLRARFDLARPRVAITLPGTPEEEFSLETDLTRLARRLSEHFGMTLGIVENENGGFPDDTEASGPTIVSVGTLREVASWFPGLTVAEVHRRFRANLVVDADEPFWEDRLYTAAGRRPFTIGDVEFLGHNPCQRCVVPSRSPVTGEVWPRFTKVFTEYRERTLPVGVARERFDHFYRLAVNSSISATSIGRVVKLRDALVYS